MGPLESAHSLRRDLRRLEQRLGTLLLFDEHSPGLGKGDCHEQVDERYLEDLSLQDLLTEGRHDRNQPEAREHCGLDPDPVPEECPGVERRSCEIEQVRAVDSAGQGNDDE